MTDPESAFPPATGAATKAPVQWEAVYVDQLAEDLTVGYRISIDEHAIAAMDGGRLDLFDAERVQAESYLLTGISPCHDQHYYWEIYVAGHPLPIKTSRLQRVLREVVVLPPVDVPRQRDDKEAT